MAIGGAAPRVRALSDGKALVQRLAGDTQQGRAVSKTNLLHQASPLLDRVRVAAPHVVVRGAPGVGGQGRHWPRREAHAGVRIRPQLRARQPPGAEHLRAAAPALVRIAAVARGLVLLHDHLRPLSRARHLHARAVRAQDHTRAPRVVEALLLRAPAEILLARLHARAARAAKKTADGMGGDGHSGGVLRAARQDRAQGRAGQGSAAT